MEWYRAHRRDLPWRGTTDPYRIWISEIMLQQTRVETVLPYYRRFLEKYPNIEALAAADEQDLLAAWAGLGYYSRARNLRRAAQQIVAGGSFPSSYEAIRALPGIGDYTAAAISSIAFALPHAVLDGNVMRVMARITNDAGDIGSAVTRSRLRSAAGHLLDPSDPGTYNQALMELGAMLCAPVEPQCLLCPVRGFCIARETGRERELPVKVRPFERKAESITLLIVRKNSTILLWQRPQDSRQMAGFWDLPHSSMLPQANLRQCIGAFQHGITNTSYTLTVWLADVEGKFPGMSWISMKRLESLPLTTTARKAIALATMNNKKFT